MALNSHFWFLVFTNFFRKSPSGTGLEFSVIFRGTSRPRRSSSKPVIDHNLGKYPSLEDILKPPNQ